MGLFNLFSGKPEPVVRVEQSGAVQPEAKKSLFQRVFGFRTKTAQNQLNSMGLDTSNIKPDVSKPFKESDLTDAEKVSMRVTLLDWAKNLTSKEIKDCIDSNNSVLLDLLFKRKEEPLIGYDRFSAVKFFETEELQKLLVQKLKEEESPNDIVVTNDSTRDVQPVPEVKRFKLNLDAIKNRSREAAQKLSFMGVKAMDRYNHLSPKQKIAVGVALSGIGIATSGATSLLSKTFSVGSAARGVYEKGEKAAKDQGRELTKEEKVKLMIKSLSIGGLIGVAGPNLIGELANFIPEDFKFLSEKFSNILNPSESIKEGVNFDSIEPNSASTAVATVMDGSDTDKAISFEPDTPTGGAIASPELGNYTIQPGDNLERILKDRVLNEAGLSDQQKLTKIYNLLSSVDGKAALQQLGISDMNKIVEGQNLDLSRLKSLFK